MTTLAFRRKRYWGLSLLGIAILIVVAVVSAERVSVGDRGNDTTCDNKSCLVLYSYLMSASLIIQQQKITGFLVPLENFLLIFFPSCIVLILFFNNERHLYPKAEDRNDR